jgi:short-chain Z-isoprenyl diphosphate synthase
MRAKWLRELLYGAYERRLTGRLDTQAIPRHIGILVDGNRRWAKLYGAAQARGTGRAANVVVPRLVRRGRCRNGTLAPVDG